MRYYGNIMTTTIWRLVDWACCRYIWVYCCCCRCILHLQQYSRRLNLFLFFFCDFWQKRFWKSVVKEKFHKADFLLRSWQSLNWLRNWPLVECWRKPANGLYLEPDEFMILFNIILPSTSRSPRLKAYVPFILYVSLPNTLQILSIEASLIWFLVFFNSVEKSGYNCHLKCLEKLSKWVPTRINIFLQTLAFWGTEPTFHRPQCSDFYLWGHLKSPVYSDPIKK